MKTIKNNARLDMTKNIKNIKKQTIYSLYFVLVISIVVFLSYGKYQANNTTEHIQNSLNFYFESNYLKGDLDEYILGNYVPNQVYEVEIEIRNYIDYLRYTQIPIIYEAQIDMQTQNVDYDIFLNGIDVTNNEHITGTLNGNIKSTDILKVRINSSSLEEICFTVNVNSTSPYEEHIDGNFRLVKAPDEIKVNLIEEQKDYSKLVIKTKDYAKNVRIAFNKTKCRPDFAHLLIRNLEIVDINDTYSYFYFNIQRNNIYNLNFIKIDPDDILTLGNTLGRFDIVYDY